MLSTGERPRELKWYHAGPMLFGDWGTSRLYVLGLAFAFTGRASFWFVLAMCLLMIGVGWSYTIVCRLSPDGGGVYSSAKLRSQLLAMVGGLLLCADYVVTASLSCLDAFHYLGLTGIHLPVAGFKLPLDAMLAAVAILAIGGFNILGPTKAGQFAMWVALATVVLTFVIGIACLPYLGSARLEAPKGDILASWIGFTEIVLALSGVEAVANMTGIMVEPVERTARRTILPVLIEIVILNLILAAAMNTLPDSILLEKNPDGTFVHTGDMLKVIAKEYVGPTFAAVSAVVFAALLLSAVNTAVGALVSIMFMFSRDKELPRAFAGLNRFGMPIWPLVVAAIVPAVVVLIFPNVELLSGLYAIGVVGAIAINLGALSTNRKLAIKPWERGLMLGLTLILIAIELTIGIVKPHARGFAMIVLVGGLAARLATIVSHPGLPLGRGRRIAYYSLGVVAILAEIALAAFAGESTLGFLASVAVAVIVGYASYETQTYRQMLFVLEQEHPVHAVAPKRLMLHPGDYQARSRVMIATQGNPKLIEFALQECKNRQGELQLLFIRHLAVTPMGTAEPPTLDEDPKALELFEKVVKQAHEAGVPLRTLYAVARDIPEAILEMAVTHGADLLFLGATRRGGLWKAMKGDVIQAVAEQLPERIVLLIHA